MSRILSIIILILCPFITISQDLKFELLTKWESLTPEFPIDFGNKKNGVDLFNIGDFNKDGINDVGLKTSKNAMIWDKSLRGEIADGENAIQQTYDGGYIVAGYTRGVRGDSAYRDYLVTKLDELGNRIWDKTFGSSDIEYSTSIQQTFDMGYIVAGYTYGSDGDISDVNNGDSDYWIVKLDGSGNKEWDKIYGEFAISVKQTSDGGYIVVGHTCIDEYMALYDHFSDYWIKKLDGSGHEEWTKTYGWPGDDYAESIQQTSDGGYIVTGRAKSCLLYTSPSPRDKRQSRMPSSA